MSLSQVEGSAWAMPLLGFLCVCQSWLTLVPSWRQSSTRWWNSTKKSLLLSYSNIKFLLKRRSKASKTWCLQSTFYVSFIFRKEKEAQEGDEETGEKKEEAEEEEEEEEEEEDDDDGGGMLGNIKTAVISLLVLSAVLAMGASFFSSCQDLTFFDGFYFCFIRLLSCLPLIFSV